MISLARAQFPLLDQALLDHFLVTELRGMFADPSAEDVFQRLSNFFQLEVEAVGGLVLALSLS